MNQQIKVLESTILAEISQNQNFLNKRQQQFFWNSKLDKNPVFAEIKT